MMIPIKLNDAIKILDERINEINFNRFEEYTIGSTIGSDLRDFYKSIMEDVTGERAAVGGDEISDGKYEIEFLMPNGKSYSCISKAWYTRDDIREVILEVIMAYYGDIKKYF